MNILGNSNCNKLTSDNRPVRNYSLKDVCSEKGIEKCLVFRSLAEFFTLNLHNLPKFWYSHDNLA